jgi:hypothetical protein
VRCAYYLKGSKPLDELFSTGIVSSCAHEFFLHLRKSNQSAGAGKGVSIDMVIWARLHFGYRENAGPDSGLKIKP